MKYHKKSKTLSEVLTHSDKWTKNGFGRKSNFQKTSFNSPESKSWCLFGAVQKAYSKPNGKPSPMMYQQLVKIYDYINGNRDVAISITEWNDDPKRTFQQVKKLLNKVKV